MIRSRGIPSLVPGCFILCFEQYLFLMWKVKGEKCANKGSLTCVPLGINYAQEYVFVPPSL